MRPKKSPIDELALCLANALEGNIDWRAVRRELSGDNVGQKVSDFARDLRAKCAANEAQILLPIDQGEELFSNADPAQRVQAQRFFKILKAMLSDDQVLPVMTLRSDYLDALQSAEDFATSLDEFSLGPMPPNRIAEIIEGPAA